MAEEIIDNFDIHELTKLIPSLINKTNSKVLLDYDKEADVLYVSFDRPQQATDSELNDNGIIVRFRDKKIIGITILEASKRNEDHKI